MGLTLHSIMCPYIQPCVAVEIKNISTSLMQMHFSAPGQKKSPTEGAVKSQLHLLASSDSDATPEMCW